MRALMSSLMNVLLIAWIASAGLAVRAVARIGRTGAMSGVTRVSSPLIRPMIRTVDPSADTRPAAGGAVEWVAQLVEGRRLDAVERRAGRLERGHEIADGRPERRVRGGARCPADDHDDLLVRIGRPARVEQVVRLARLELALVRVRVGVRGIDPAHRQADREQPDGRDEPQRRDRPAVARAPHRDPHRGGFAAHRLGRGRDGHRGPSSCQDVPAGRAGRPSAVYGLVWTEGSGVWTTISGSAAGGREREQRHALGLELALGPRRTPRRMARS